jgi:hypothetical protein
MPIAVITGGQYIYKGNPPPQFDVSTRQGKQAFNDWVLSSASWGCSWTFQLKPGETEDVFKAPDWKFKPYFGGAYQGVQIFDLSAYTPPKFATLPAEEQVKKQEEKLAQTVEKLSEVSPPPEEQVKKQEIPIVGSTRNLIIIIVLIIIGFLVYKGFIKKL